MGKYEGVYSEQGLIELIDETKENIKNSKIELQEVINGKRYNPLCKDNWIRQINNNISEYENTLVEFENALKVKQLRLNN